MTPHPRTPGLARAILRRAVAVAAAVGLAIPLTTVVGSDALAAPPGQSPGRGIPTGPTASADPGSYRITLLTGDVVVLQVNADGRQAAWVTDPATPHGAPAQVYEADGHLHVVPAEASPYLATGALDPHLFNVSLLAQHGYDDDATSELPLLVAASEQASASSVPPTPRGADRVRVLDSVNTLSVTVDKATVRQTWEDLRGPAPAATVASRARLVGNRQVWLNAKVEATLADSVAQIGADHAWSSGVDGRGTTVAVLDSGADEGHPDLVGRVTGRRSFVEEDPDSSDRLGHGTHVAATVGGTGAGSDGANRGVAPGTDLLIGKVLDDTGSGYADQIIAGMEWATTQEADIVNMSLGTPWPSDGTDLLSQAVDTLSQESDTLFVIAAGNNGPGEWTVGAPGAASTALTVGAVTKADQPAAFSSRGPRLGDDAIKPEITAPGVGIVAARAAGTAAGEVLDPHYTAMSGTSMAAPHVAGAAALLAQQHPGWTAAELKARLISTTHTLADQPVSFQGAGRVDVIAALDTPIAVDTGAISWGTVARDDGPVRAPLSYTNHTPRAVRLQLSSTVANTGAGGSSAALLLDRRTVTVPAHGTATTAVELRPGATDPGRYAGQVVAQAGNTGAVHTTVAVTVSGPTHTVTVRAKDRAGRPASGPVDLWNADTGELTRGFLDEGTTTFEVSEGTYCVVGAIGDAGWWWDSRETTLAAHPELEVTGDETLTWDARAAGPLEVRTPRSSELDAVDLLWHRSIGERKVTMLAAQGLAEHRVHVLRSPVARTGDFTFGHQWQYGEPLLTVDTDDPAEPIGTSRRVSDVAWTGDERLSLVDAGTGSRDELAAVPAAGSVVLVSRGPQWGDLAEQAQAAAEEGAAVLLAHDTDGHTWPEPVPDAAIPVYLISGTDGRNLREALEADSGLEVDLHGIRDANYKYQLAFREHRLLSGGAVHRAEHRTLATVTSDYRQNSGQHELVESWIPYLDGLGVGNAMSTTRSGPVVRTEYVSAEGVEWQRWGQPSPWSSYYWTSDQPTRYEAGSEHQQVWWGPLIAPVVPTQVDGSASAAVLGATYPPVTRFRDAIVVRLPHYSYGGSLAGTIYEQFGDRSDLVLTTGGEEIGRSTWPDTRFTVPSGNATYRLRLDVVNGEENWSDTSTRTRTTWEFESGSAPDSGTVLPLVQTRYGLKTDGHNQVPTGRTQELVLHPGYQPGGAGPGGFTGEVAVSFDDGATWREAGVTKDGDRLLAAVPAADGPGFASVRITITDSDGNRLEQRIDRAWKVAARLLS